MRDGDAAERITLVRRVFLFAALGAGVLALLGSVSYLIFVFLRDALEADLSLAVLREAKIAIGIIVPAVVFLPYYWLVYRQDRLAEPEAAAPPAALRRKDVTVVAIEGGGALVRNLEAALGYRVTVLERADPGIGLPELSDVEYQALAQRISDAAGQNVLLVPDLVEVRVLSYR